MDLETFDPMITERTEWSVRNKSGFFLKVLPLFKQLSRTEFEEILKQVNAENVDYFEIAHYEAQSDLSPEQAPSSVLVFDEGKIFFDILDVDHKDRLIAKFKKLAGDSAKFLNSRPITKDELLKRLEALSFLDDNEESLENSLPLTLSSTSINQDRSGLNNSVAKDEYNILDRSAFTLEAKQPALAWIIENEKNEPNDVIQLGVMNWSLDKINEEPSVFLLPSDIDLLSKADQNRIWKRAKKKAFEEFLSSFCNDEKLWPKNLNDKLFDQWFTIRPMGLMIDLTEGE